MVPCGGSMEKKIEENDEECLYEKFRAIAEEDPERKIAVLVQNESEIKAAYRAAVYGEIFLLFGDIFTKEDAESARERARRAFCELIEEHHEFNGFIPKGILVDTPLALLSNLSVQGFDFFCYDIEKISLLLTGNKKSILQKQQKAIQDLIRKYSSKVLPHRNINFKSPLEQGIWKYRS